ncbi:hypothetical protein ACCT30_06955, partial [Rhizobium ruizarguesonis]
ADLKQKGHYWLEIEIFAVSAMAGCGRTSRRPIGLCGMPPRWFTGQVDPNDVSRCTCFAGDDRFLSRYEG